MMWLGLIFFTILAAFFSGVEIGYVSFTPIKIELMRKKRPVLADKISEIRNDWDSFLTTMLIGNNIALISASAIFTLIAEDYGITSEWIVTLLFTPPMLLLAESGPKLLFRTMPEALLPITYPLVKFFLRLFAPFSFAFKKIMSFIARLFGIKPGTSKAEKSVFVTREELLMLLYQEGSLSKMHKDEASLLKRVLRFSSIPALKIMTPIEQIVGVDSSALCRDVLALARSAHFTRYPVYEAPAKDKIIGFVHIMDVAFAKKDSPIDICVRPVIFMHHCANLYSVFRQMQLSRSQIVILYDDNYRNRGMITVKDIIDEVLGEVD